MKKIISLLLVFLSLQAAWAQGGSGAGYDPSNPPDPQANYKLTAQASPAYGGNGSWGTWRMEIGSQIHLWAEPREGFTFRAWMKGDEVISNEPSFYYTMPQENVVLTAWFDFDGNYNPSNPGDPWADGYMHWIRSYAYPSSGGWISNNNFRIREGDTAYIYAYPHGGYRFSNWKKDGKIISTERQLEIKMGESDLEYTATFVYDPENPGDPNTNSWNRSTGELIIDDFRPGDLWSAVWNTLEGTDFDLVDSFIVIGQINPYDFNVSNNFPNLVTADFSRTSGAHYVPYTGFSHLYSLTKLYLPSGIQEIEYAGLDHLTSLSELILYAVVPPDVTQDSFWYMPDDFIVRVYSGSVDLYESAPVWQNYKIMTIDGESAALTVNLPADAKDGRYKNSSLQLNNLATGQSSKLIISANRVQYVFGNLIPDMKYSLYAMAPNGSVIGKYLEFEIPEEGMEYTFDSLLQLQGVSLSVLTPDNEDIADKVGISWFDSKGNVIGSGASLPGQIAGETVSYEISLPNEYGIVYKAPEKGNYTITDSDNLIKVQLVTMPFVEIVGYLKDAVEGVVIPDAYVTISQTLNGSYSVSSTVSSDNSGKFAIKIYDAPGSVTVGANDYLETTVNFENLEDAKKLASILLKAIGGTELNLTLLKRENILKNATNNAFSEYKDYANVEFEVKNLTTGNNESFVLKYPRLVLSDDVKDGEKLLITATPSKSNLNPESEEVEINNGKANVKFAFTTNGDIAISYNDSEAERVTGLLYYNNGKLYSKANFQNKEAIFKYVPAGDYTLVTVEENKLFSALSNLEELNNLPYEAEKDYLLSHVTVEDGYISQVELDIVPVLDESVFNFTTPETSVTVNKTNVTVGATVTVRSKVQFLPEYADVEKVNIIFTIPEGCEYVDNSLLVPGNGANFTTISDGKISVEVPVKDASPRFCIIPRVSGEYRPSAVIEFEHDGALIRQPIGSALFTAGDFTISVPDRTGTPTITARGSTYALSEVRVYDNNVYVGSTHALSNGDWRLKFDLFKPGEDGTEHFIYGAITTPEGHKYNTVTGKTTYYHGTGILTDIEMIYGGNLIDFNYVEASTEPISYSYVPGNDMFTFMAIFRDGLGSSIKNLNFVILLSDGSRRTISGRYLVGTETWTCALSFPDVNRLPVNVKVVYSEDPAVELVDDIEEIWRCPDVIPIIDPSGYVYEAVHSNRVPDVTSTIYYRELTEDNYGNVVEKAVKWDAEAYAQENPLFTDEDGMYQWDVPSGDWQVRFEKEGYEAAQTEWLPVPPPQLDVNIPISQMLHPEVKNAYAYPGSVQIEFNLYMDPATLNSKNIKVMADDKEIAGEIQLLNEEEGADGKTYASVVIFKAEQPFEAESVTLLVAKVKSYAGVQMAEPYSQEFDVETPITDIVSPEETNAYVGYDKTITVKVEPKEASAGKLLYIHLNTPILGVDEKVQLDEEGQAEITLTGMLPGKAQLRFNVEDIYFDSEYTTDVNVDIITAELPEASVESGSPVYRHGAVEIFTDSKIGKIYYTTDGTEPTETNGTLYEGPVTISEETLIKAINVIDDAVYSVSDVAEFNFPLKREAIATELHQNWNWISHNLENEVKLDELAPVNNVVRILSKTDEAVNETNLGLIGTLKTLSPEEGYKVFVSEAFTLAGKEDIALHPATPYSVYSGWNWIGFHGINETVVNDALSGTEAETGDMIVGQDGFATFNGEKWIGDLVSLKPHAGYIYFSQSVKEVGYSPVENNIYTIPAHSDNTSNKNDLNVDKYKYPSVMPVIAEVVDQNGVPLNMAQLEITAYCGDELRGVGVYSDGYLFISVYGNIADEIRFRMRNADETSSHEFVPSVVFSEESLGSLDNPYLLDMALTGGISNILVDGAVSIEVKNGEIIIEGNDISSVIISDTKGINHFVNKENASRVSVDSLAPGIYFVSVVDGGVRSRHKVVVK